MLGWIIVFFIVVIISGILGFTGLLSGGAFLAKIIFYISLILLIIALIMHLKHRSRVL